MLQNESLDIFLEDYLGNAQKREEYFAKKNEDVPEEEWESDYSGEIAATGSKTKLSKRTIASMLVILILIPLTIAFGIVFMEDRKYYFISLMIIIYSLIPFIMVFEGRKPQARELITISVLAALAVAGRAAFFMLPQFKPVAALVIISGVCFGGEAGFLVGAVSALISNFFFGQGPWTPWQMFAFGLIGFLAGIFYRKKIITTKRISLCIYGFLSVQFIYGFLLNTSTVFMYTQGLNWKTVLSIYMMGVPMDFIHAISTVIFLWFISKPMIEKLERIKKKYGLIG